MTKGPHIKIIVAGGGTGGHIFPAIAIANAVKSKDPKAEILFVGAKGKMEMEKVPKEGYQIIGLDIVGFERKSLFKNLALPWKLFRSFMHARKILKEFQPDVVIGVGGYVHPNSASPQSSPRPLPTVPPPAPPTSPHTPFEKHLSPLHSPPAYSTPTPPLPPHTR